MQKLVKKHSKAKGFTLVELLIVVIIIGILASMMMLSTSSATDKAEATKIVVNLRNIKAACVMYYADNSQWPTGGTWTIGTCSLDKYLDQKPAGYTVTVDGESIVAKATGSDTNPKFTADSGVAKKLKAMQNDAGITVSGDVASMVVKSNTN